MQKAILFDIDDTLYDQTKPLCDACEEAAGVRIFDRELFFNTFRRYSDAAFYASESSRISLEDSRLYRILNTMKELSLPMTVPQAESFQLLYQEKLYQIRLSEGLSGLMDTLSHAGVLMGILSNGPLEHQLRKYYALGMDRWIPRKRVIISSEVGCSKPSVEIFRVAEKALGLVPDQAWMVGDSLINDIAGAAGAGWHTIWYNHHAGQAGGLQPDVIVTTEAEMIACLKALFTVHTPKETKEDL